MIKSKFKKIIVFVFIYFFIDLSMTQLFLFNFYYDKLEKRHESDLINRISNKNYKYTFEKKKSFVANYLGTEYTVKTNNLGFRDYKVRDLDKSYNYTIVIGDSYVEGVAIEYKDTMVGHLNKKIKSNKIEKFEFLNAGVASYSSYIYLKKIITIIKENPWLKVVDVIVVLDKSDIMDATNYFDRPESFPEKKVKHKFRSTQFFLKDLKEGHIWRFLYKQTTTGAFIKKVGDIVELKVRNLRDRYKLSKKLKKGFFEIDRRQVDAVRSINTRTDISGLLHGNLWETRAKKSIDFEISNLVLLKEFLNKKKIDLIVLLFPWPYEIANRIPRENYINYIIPKLEQNKINYISSYKKFLEGDIYINISDNYIYNDNHLNKNGYKILSDEIWKYYKEKD